MLSRITHDVLAQIKNPVFRDNAQMYLNIESSYRNQIAQFGLPIAEENHHGNESFITPTDTAVRALMDNGLNISNDFKSLHTGWISPSCLSCRTGIGSATYTISTQCPRNCFFCFNPNQENYLRLQHQKEDPSAQLAEVHTQGRRLSDIALTGGEPLVHKEETITFFQTAKRLFPNAYTRLYTSGSYLDEACLKALAQAGLDEIRFSLKTDDSPEVFQKTLERIGKAREYLEFVVVEMPVMPDELTVMQELLITLDELKVDGINLLELCFPFNNAEEFLRRGYAIKNEQLRVLYNYWYAGGLPIAGSESVCLSLLDFALQENLQMGVHYCSLENKFSGQIYQQNYLSQSDYPFCTFSERDYFLKSAKVYGSDAHQAAKVLSTLGLGKIHYDKQTETLEFSPAYLSALKDGYPHLEVALSYHIVEHERDETLLRELRLDLTTPASFNPTEDL